MLNRSASLAMSTCVLKALPGKLDIKRHSPSILYIISLYCSDCAETDERASIIGDQLHLRLYILSKLCVSFLEKGK